MHGVVTHTCKYTHSHIFNRAYSKYNTTFLTQRVYIPDSSTWYTSIFHIFDPLDSQSHSKQQTSFTSRNKQACTIKPNSSDRTPPWMYIRRQHLGTFSQLSPVSCHGETVGSWWKSSSKSLMSKPGPTQAGPCWRRTCSVEKFSLLPSHFIPQLEKSMWAKEELPAAYSMQQLHKGCFGDKAPILQLQFLWFNHC